MQLSKSHNYDDYYVKKHAVDDNGQVSHIKFSNRHGSVILTVDRLRELFGPDPLPIEEMVRRIDREIGGEN
jgi:hypothetical protein